eukprot:gene443-biopygen178
MGIIVNGIRLARFDSLRIKYGLLESVKLGPFSRRESGTTLETVEELFQYIQMDEACSLSSAKGQSIAATSARNRLGGYGFPKRKSMGSDGKPRFPGNTERPTGQPLALNRVHFAAIPSPPPADSDSDDLHDDKRHVGTRGVDMDTDDRPGKSARIVQWESTLTGDEVDVVAARDNLLTRLILKVVVMFVVLLVQTLSVEGQVAVLAKGLAVAGVTVPWIWLYAVNTKTATDMIFNTRSGSNQIVTLADSGATGCLLAQDMAERLGLHIRPWEHGNEGFTCANEGIIGINGTATLPFSIQRFKGSAHVHAVDILPGGLDMILGSAWMRKGILDYDDMRLILNRHGFDPVISGRKAAKFLKAGANHIMVNIRDSRPVDYPASNVSATKTADLLAKVLPSSVPLPNPPEVEVDFETWVRENCPEHGDPALMPTHVVRHLLHKFKKVFNALPMQTPKHRDIPHVIMTKENAYAPYRCNRCMSPAEMALCEEYVAGLLKHGFITPSSSPYGAPIMIIAKPGGVGYRVVLQDEEFYAKLAKCTFNQSEVKFLGHIIGCDGVKVNPKKVATVRD